MSKLIDSLVDKRDKLTKDLEALNAEIAAAKAQELLDDGIHRYNVTVSAVATYSAVVYGNTSDKAKAVVCNNLVNKFTGNIDTKKFKVANWDDLSFDVVPID